MKNLLLLSTLLLFTGLLAAQNLYTSNGKIGLSTNNFNGIGTQYPTTSLHVLRNDWAGIRIESTLSDTDPMLLLKAVGGEWAFHNDASKNNSLSIRLDNQEKIRVDQSGQMSIRSDGWNHFDIGATGAGKDAVIRLFDDQDFWSIHHDDSDGNKLAFRFNNQAQLALHNNGQLSIGTLTVPGGYRLAVNGKIICEEIKVQLSQDWPDYVFRPTYQLLNLEEVEQHIHEKGHLPGIPSAEEIERKGGIEVGDLTVNQQEKIEELFLHLIEMQKQLKKLQSENKILKAQIKAISK